jgi:protein-S-isoprenylcysteine O-methyltransferase Ste14
VIVVELFTRFVREGRGTPAPYLLTRHLIVTGLYRHVRNPMYVSILTILAGQALLLGQGVLLGYAVLVGVVLHAWVVLVEEPRLERDFGTDYRDYASAVRRWIPRWTAWKG